VRVLLSQREYEIHVGLAQLARSRCGLFSAKDIESAVITAQHVEALYK
jgi:hypothetical protein